MNVERLRRIYGNRKFTGASPPIRRWRNKIATLRAARALRVKVQLYARALRLNDPFLFPPQRLLYREISFAACCPALNNESFKHVAQQR